MEFLRERDFEFKLNLDKYIIASTEKAKRTTIEKNISKRFIYFIKELNSNKHYTFKSLRKNYTTELYIFNGGNVKSITGHSSNSVIENHYLEKQRISLDFSKRKFRI